MRYEYNSNDNDPLNTNSINYSRPMPPAFARIVCIVLLSIGILMLGLATYFYLKQVEFMKTAVRSPARIVELIEDTGEIGKNDTVYRAQLVFTADDGKEYNVQSSTGYSSGLQRIGDQVEVIYAPGKPQEADLDSFFGNWFSIVLYVIGLALFGLSSLGLYLMRRQSRRA